MNQVILCGTAENTPVLSHTNYGRNFYRFTLSVARLSGTYDHIPVLAPQTLCADVHAGDEISVSGEVRSFNDREAVHNRLKINVWAQSILPWTQEHRNIVTLQGKLCKPAIYRRTPFGREIADMMLCVQRQYPSPTLNRFDYLPCIAWGSVARLCAELAEWTQIELTGRIQSRAYVKLLDGVPNDRTAYEISIASVRLPGEDDEQVDCME